MLAKNALLAANLASGACALFALSYNSGILDVAGDPENRSNLPPMVPAMFFALVSAWINDDSEELRPPLPSKYYWKFSRRLLMIS